MGCVHEYRKYLSHISFTHYHWSSFSFHVVSPGLLVQRGLCTAPSSGCDAQRWMSVNWDHRLLKAGAAYTKTLTLIFKAENRPNGNGISMPTKLFVLVCVCLSVCPHLEFQCIEGVFGGAAERPLSDHLHRVEQLMALSPQRTSDL